MKRNFVMITLLMFLIVFSFSSFTGTELPKGETPGTIEFIGDAGSPNVFVFDKWEFNEVAIPNEDFTQVKVGLTIYTGSLRTEWKDLEKSIRKKKDYFYTKKFPKATVQIDGATLQANGTYKTQAALTLKGISKPVELTFTVSDTTPYRIQGEGAIIRQNFKFTGGGPKDEVPIKFDVVLPE